jgi:ubiquinone/menaquinone biosynthesis C-methylase UbiE/DNA-binding transcriptional ArsR family regulator
LEVFFVVRYLNQDKLIDMQAKVIDMLQLLSDPVRIRLAALLDGAELSVAEITLVTRMVQSRVSTHLGKLREAGILRDRRQGTKSYYTLNESGMPETARRLWQVVADNRDEAEWHADRARCEEVLRMRQKPGGWPDSVAGQMDRHYSPGRTWEATMLSFLSFVRLGDVLDAGSGDGMVASMLAPRCRTITCLDLSPKVLQAARQRLANLRNVTFAPGDIHALPFPDGQFDQVLLLNVLPYSKEPARALGEAARVLGPGGALLVSTLASHDHAEITSAYGHVNRGFRPSSLRRWLAEDARLTVDRCEITSQEKQQPHFAVLCAFARKPGSTKESP